MKSHTVHMLKALADETRLEIVRILMDKKEMTCQDLMKRFSLSQPTLSHHFNKLVDVHILDSKKEGVLWIYRLNTKFLKDAGIDISRLVHSSSIS